LVLIHLNVTRLLSLPFIPQSVYRQVHNLFHSEFSTVCELVHNLLSTNIFTVPGITQYLLAPFSSFSRPFYPYIYISSNNMF